jgi:hypothetical protein
MTGHARDCSQNRIAERPGRIRLKRTITPLAIGWRLHNLPSYKQRSDRVRHSTKREGVVKKLRKLPAVANKLPIVTKRKARSMSHTPEKTVQTVQDELVRLLESGYSVAEVGKVLRSAGIEVSAVTLRGYVRDATAASKRAVRADSPRTGPVKKKSPMQKSTVRSASSESAAAAAGNAPVARKKPAASPPPATAKARTPASKQSVKSSSVFHDHGNLHLAKATFVVRPDTPDSDL